MVTTIFIIGILLIVGRYLYIVQRDNSRFVQQDKSRHHNDQSIDGIDDDLLVAASLDPHIYKDTFEGFVSEGMFPQHSRDDK